MKKHLYILSDSLSNASSLSATCKGTGLKLSQRTMSQPLDVMKEKLKTLYSFSFLWLTSIYSSIDIICLPRSIQSLSTICPYSSKKRWVYHVMTPTLWPYSFLIIEHPYSSSSRDHRSYSSPASTTLYALSLNSMPISLSVHQWSNWTTPRQLTIRTVEWQRH